MVNRYNIRKYRIASIWPIEILLIEIIAYPTFFRIVGRFIERNSTIRTFVFFRQLINISLPSQYTAEGSTRLYSYIFPKFFDRRYSNGDRPNCFLKTDANLL